MYSLFTAHIPFLAVLIAGFFLWCYIVASSVEFGLSLLILFPRLAGERSLLVITILNPIWEVNNVFLVGFFVSLFAFFPGFVPWLTITLFTPLCIFVAVSGARILLVLVFFYSSWEWLKKSLVVRSAFALCSFAGPVLLAVGAVAVLTGIAPSLWPASFFWLVAAAVCVALSSLAAFAGLFGRKTFGDVAVIAYAASAIWFFKMLPFYMPWVSITHPQFLSSAFTWTSLLLVAALALVFAGRLVRRPAIAFTGLAAVAGILIIFVAALQQPYLAYPFVSAASAFTALATAKILFGAFAGGSVILIPSILLLYWLFVFNKKPVVL